MPVVHHRVLGGNPKCRPKVDAHQSDLPQRDTQSCLVFTLGQGVIPKLRGYLVGSRLVLKGTREVLDALVEAGGLWRKEHLEVLVKQALLPLQVDDLAQFGIGTISL